MERDRHLAVGRLAERPAVLPRYPDRVAALLREARVVEHDHPVRRGQRRGHPSAVGGQDWGRVPGALVDELLQVLLVAARHPPAQRLDRLALTIQQQPVEVDPPLAELVAAREQRPELERVGVQPLEHLGVQFRRERPSHGLASLPHRTERQRTPRVTEASQLTEQY
jgi:hypothetical protein